MATGIFDLETYIRAYELPTAIQRLVYIAANSQQLKPEVPRRVARVAPTPLHRHVESTRRGVRSASYSFSRMALRLRVFRISR